MQLQGYQARRHAAARKPTTHTKQDNKVPNSCSCCPASLRRMLLLQTHLLASANFCQSCAAIASASFSASTPALLDVFGHLHAALLAPLVLPAAGAGAGFGSRGAGDGLACASTVGLCAAGLGDALGDGRGMGLGTGDTSGRVVGLGLADGRGVGLGLRAMGDGMGSHLRMGCGSCADLRMLVLGRGDGLVT
jgi:hypothetical protein